jgi:hypothetical protein
MLQHIRHGQAARRFRRTVAPWLQPIRLEELVKALAVLVLVVALPFAAGGALFIPETVTTTLSQPEATANRTSTDGVLSESDSKDVAQSILDLYGNEVSDAIATYSLDKAGSLYELHSPQTELPRLGAPKS